MVKIDAGHRALIPPLSDDERAQLERNLQSDGCRETLAAWYALRRETDRALSRYSAGGLAVLSVISIFGDLGPIGKSAAAFAITVFCWLALTVQEINARSADHLKDIIREQTQAQLDINNMRLERLDVRAIWLLFIGLFVTAFVIIGSMYQ